MSGDGTYAPKSPDLSSFYSAGGPTSAPSAPAAQPRTAGAQLQQLPSQQSSQFSPQQRLHLQPPATTYFPGAPAHSQQRFLQGQQQQQQKQQQQEQAHPQNTPQHQAPVYSPYFSTLGQTAPQSGPGYSSSPLQSPQSPQSPQQQKASPFYGQPYGAHYKPHFPVQPAQFYSSTTAPAATSAPPPPLIGQADALSSSPPSFAEAQAAGIMPPKRGAAAAPPPAIDPSPVKTKFPTARIKRIMQADEEVGKVAQQTPIAVGKALEMFMVNLVTKSADVAREKNSKRVSAQMLKQVVESDDQWDFLRDIVSRVENEEKAAAAAGSAGAPSAGKGRARVESESEEEVIPEKKKRVGRKKRAA